MAFVVPFKEKFVGEEHTVFYVNKSKKEKFCSSVTTSEKCPNCSTRHVYKVFDNKGYYELDGWGIEIYDCICPKCNEEFDLEVEYELESY